MRNLKNIILVGPMASGKSSVAEQITSLTSLKTVSVDKLKWYYRFKNGFDLVRSKHILRTNGYEAFFGPNEIADLLSQFEGVVDFSSSDTGVKDMHQLANLYKVFDPYPNVFLILPYEDDNLSQSVMEKRIIKRLKDDPDKGPILNTYLKKNIDFLYNPNNLALSKHVIYLNDRPFHHVAQEILYKCDFAEIAWNTDRAVSMVS